jgi:hypothetical protein
VGTLEEKYQRYSKKNSAMKHLRGHNTGKFSEKVSVLLTLPPAFSFLGGEGGIFRLLSPVQSSSQLPHGGTACSTQAGVIR